MDEVGWPKVAARSPYPRSSAKSIKKFGRDSENSGLSSNVLLAVLDPRATP